SVGMDNTLRLWDTATGKSLHTLSPNFATYIHELAFSQDARLLAGPELGGAVHLWDVTTGKPLRRIDACNTGALTFAPDGKTLATSEGSGIHLWDVRTGKECLTWPGHRWGVQSLAFAADSKSLISGGDDAVLWWRSFDGSWPQCLADDLGRLCKVTAAANRPL